VGGVICERKARNDEKLSSYFTENTVPLSIKTTQYEINPYPANVENMVELLIMPADGRWDLTRRLTL
jgi:hypothetical protein